MSAADHVVPGYEDTWYYLWKERRLPANVDPLKSNLENEEERKRLAQDLRTRSGPGGGLRPADSPDLQRRRDHALGKRPLAAAAGEHVPLAGRFADGLAAAVGQPALVRQRRHATPGRSAIRWPPAARCLRAAGARRIATAMAGRHGNGPLSPTYALRTRSRRHAAGALDAHGDHAQAGAGHCAGDAGPARSRCVARRLARSRGARRRDAHRRSRRRRPSARRCAWKPAKAACTSSCRRLPGWKIT